MRVPPAEIDEFRKRGIPLDMLGLEPGWHDHASPCCFEWDAKRFPYPAGFLAELGKRHMRAKLWFNPYVSPTALLHAQLLPFAGSHLVWNGIAPDYTLAESRTIFADRLLKKILSLNPAAITGCGPTTWRSVRARMANSSGRPTACCCYER